MFDEIFKRKCYGMWKIFTVIVFMIIIYWFILLRVHGTEHNAVNGDFMNHIVFETSFLENCCSWWPISHFILFTVIGFLFPDCDLMAILAGIGWELAEVGVYYTIGEQRQGVRRPGSSKIQYSGSWWNGSYKDIFMNIAGFYTGKALSIACGKGVCEEDKNEKV